MEYLVYLEATSKIHLPTRKISNLFIDDIDNFNF